MLQVVWYRAGESLLQVTASLPRASSNFFIMATMRSGFPSPSVTALVAVNFTLSLLLFFIIWQIKEGATVLSAGGGPSTGPTKAGVGGPAVRARKNRPVTNQSIATRISF